jgi:hypothetical protein
LTTRGTFHFPAVCTAQRTMRHGSEAPPSITSTRYSCELVRWDPRYRHLQVSILELHTRMCIVRGVYCFRPIFRSQITVIITYFTMLLQLHRLHESLCHVFVHSDRYRGRRLNAHAHTVWDTPVSPPLMSSLPQAHKGIIRHLSEVNGRFSF